MVPYGYTRYWAKSNSALPKCGANPSIDKVKKEELHPKWQKAIAEKVDKLTKTEFIKEVNYPDLLANAILVKKANEKWWKYIDFTDLNKACLKDSYPLPQIDQLVDAIIGHELLTFIDAFFIYKQIRKHPRMKKRQLSLLIVVCSITR